ncbi:hypothetical protein [Maridesulfovibrio ferrireducens]|uniref:Uncharacterized protein n=1 Tax=Maridesulfovibrio ferrireducens TaxID=246191 RepID=A0A1G9L5G9_9BACT|nr:hypothetical protein [Maridesulfovibrio ferrireducens]MBI9110068.1 hypothetical protein [Maridesulfovibrio ferrireducens]SDL56963.1 hypothetical protein SAMN05660337_3273 [Maridesulfovibrio ferrireducens]
MNKDTGIGEKSDPFKKMEQNDLFKFRSISNNIAAMVKSLDDQEKADSLESDTDQDEV